MAKNRVNELQKALDLLDEVVTIVKKVQVEIAGEQERAESRKENGEA